MEAEWKSDIGCVLVPLLSMQKTKTLMRRKGWVPNALPYVRPGPEGFMVMAITNPEALAFFGGSERRLTEEDGAQFPPDIEWVPGMRLEQWERPKVGAPVHPLEGILVVPPPRFTHAELFSGIGGFSQGLAALGGTCVFASEIDATKCIVFERNFPGAGAYLWGNIGHVYGRSIPDHDMLTAGFPCEPFSHANQNRLGFGECRGQIFWQIVRVLQMKKPSCFLLENVPGLLTFEEGNAFQMICDALTGSGYAIHHRVINALAFVPQSRKRLYIVGCRNDLVAACAVPFEFPELPVGKCVPPTCGEVLEPDVAATYTLTDSQWRHVTETWNKHGPRPIEKKLMQVNGWASTLTKSYRKGYRMYSEFVSQAGGANPRFITPRECARLMGFPETFALADKESEAYAHMGSAVCPPVITHIGHALINWVEAARRTNT